MGWHQNEVMSNDVQTIVKVVLAVIGLGVALIAIALVITGDAPPETLPDALDLLRRSIDIITDALTSTLIMALIIR